VKLKTKEEEQPIEDLETDGEEDEIEDLDPEEEPEETPIRKTPKKKKKDNVDELVSEYKKLKMEWENLFKEKQ
jgi:hypothetical protein